MARTSLAAAKAELFALLSSADGVPTMPGPVVAFDFDPWGTSYAQGPIYLTVTTAGMDPDFFTFAVRLVADAGADPKYVHAQLDTIMPAVSTMVTDRYGPENWVGPQPHPDRSDVMVCEWLVQCGREDF